MTLKSTLKTYLNPLDIAKPEEITALFWACTYFFCLMCSYYTLRPIREEMGILGGIKNLRWLFLATFIAMLALTPLFGWITSKSPRSRFMPYCYAFFVINLITAAGARCLTISSSASQVVSAKYIRAV